MFACPADYNWSVHHQLGAFVPILCDYILRQRCETLFGRLLVGAILKER